MQCRTSTPRGKSRPVYGCLCGLISGVLIFLFGLALRSMLKVK